MTHELEGFVAELVAAGEVTAASALVGTADQIVATAATGDVAGEGSAPVSTHSLFDLASLSKPVTATVALALEAAGELRLDSTAGEVFENVDSRLEPISIEELLRHRAGLRPWAPLMAIAADPEEAHRWLLSGEGLVGPRESNPEYGDLAYIVAALALETQLGRRLESIVRERLVSPLGSIALESRPIPGRVVASRLSNERERELAAALGFDLAVEAGPWRGVPQDGNARFLGGFPGHAGLFADSAALWRLGVEWLRPGRLFDAAAVERALAGDGGFSLGWWTGRGRRHAGPALSSSAFGMVGFTGGSWFLDPERDLVLVLLAHRSHLGIEMAPHRRSFHRLAVEIVGAGAPGGRDSSGRP